MNKFYEMKAAVADARGTVEIVSPTQVVEWEEPYGEWLGRTLSLRCTLSLEDAIAAGHIIHAAHGRAVSDAEALDEFIVVNYATVKREK